METSLIGGKNMSRRQEKIQELKQYKNKLLWHKYNNKLSREAEQKIPQFKRSKSKQKILTLYR